MSRTCICFSGSNCTKEVVEIDNDCKLVTYTSLEKNMSKAREAFDALKQNEITICQETMKMKKPKKSILRKNRQPVVHFNLARDGEYRQVTRSFFWLIRNFDRFELINLTEHMPNGYSQSLNHLHSTRTRSCKQIVWNECSNMTSASQSYHCTES